VDDRAGDTDACRWGRALPLDVVGVLRRWDSVGRVQAFFPDLRQTIARLWASIGFGSSREPSQPEDKTTRWCLVGNVVASCVDAETGEVKRGTKHFAAGTKVWCLPGQWGDGYEKIVVIGRHRGSRRLVRMVIPAKRVTNCRAQVVYSPAVLRLLTKPRPEGLGSGARTYAQWDSKEHVDGYVYWMNRRG